MRWDPEQYLQFAAERGRPFQRPAGPGPGDRGPRWSSTSGCGPGNLTRAWPHRWPEARVEGIDSSPEMIAQADADGPTGGWPSRSATCATGSRRSRSTSWSPTRPCSGCRATSTCCPGWSTAVRPGGWLAFQVPGNFGDRSHTAMPDVATSPRWAERFGSAGPGATGRRSRRRPTSSCWRGLGCTVDAGRRRTCTCWPATDAVVRWISGTGLRPYLQALGDDDGARGVPGRVPGAGRRDVPAAAVGHGAAVPSGLRGGPARQWRA